MVTKKNFSEALQEMFNTVSRSSRIYLIHRSDRYGYLLCAGNTEYFIPENLEYRLELMYFKKLFYKPRRVKHPTVGGLERYLNYCKKRAFKNKEEFLLDCSYKKKEDSSLNDFERLPWNIPAKYFDDNQEGKKYDNGKPMAGTLTDVFSRALMAVGACIEYGTHKYPDPKNWQLVDNGIKRYRDAMIRHLLKYNAGIDKDGETKLPHLAHMAWNALAILELYMQEHKDELDKEIFK